MNVLKKRLIPCVLAVALMLAMAAPAFASGSPSTVITGVYQQTTIEVTVPETGSAVINPYGLPIEFKKPDSSPAEVWAKSVGQQIVTQPLFIINNSDVALSVSATATVKINTVGTGTQMMLSSSPLGETSQKTAFVYLQAKSSTQETSTGNLDATSDLTGGKGGKVSKEEAYKEYANWKQAYDATADIVLNPNTTNPTAKRIGYLSAVETSGSDLKYTKGSILMVRLSGQVVEEPREAWSERDGFSATISFTFKPASTGVNVTKDSATSGDLAGDVITFSATNGEIQLTAALADTSVNIDTDVASIKWTSDASPSNISLTGDTTKTVTVKVNTSVTTPFEDKITVTIKGKNGVTYTSEIVVKLDI